MLRPPFEWGFLTILHPFGTTFTGGVEVYRLEVADMWTPEGERMKGSTGPSFSSAWPPRRHSRHNLNFSVGVVLGIH